MRLFPQKNSFTRGQFSGLLMNRVDEAVYQDGCAELTNMMALPVGGITRRAGTRYLTDATAGTVNLHGFAFNQDENQTYCLEFGDKTLRFLWGDNQELIMDPASLYPALKFTYGGTGAGWDSIAFSGTYTGTERIVLRVECSSTSPNVFYYYINGHSIDILASAGDHVLSNGIKITVTLGLSCEVGDYWETELYWPLTLKTPWGADQVDELRFCQKEDSLLIVHADTIPRVLQRLDHDSWDLQVADWTGAPWKNQTGLKYRIYDVTQVWGTYKNNAVSKAYMDTYFSENHGASLVDSGHWDNSVNFSLASVYYTKSDLFDSITGTHASYEVYGNLYIPAEGDYQFSLNVGDLAGDLLIDGELTVGVYGASVTPSDPTGGATFETYLSNKAQTVSLTKGIHRFRARVWFALAHSNSLFAVYWKAQGDTTFEIIPAKYFCAEDQVSRYGVSSSTFNYFDLSAITIPAPMDEAGFATLFTTETTDVVLDKTGKWEDRFWFHSQAGMSSNPFTADRPPDFCEDNQQFSLEVTGWITISETGDYGFALDTNDGAELLIYDTDIESPLVDLAWLSNEGLASGDSGFTQAGLNAHSTTASMTAGVYHYRVRFWNAGFGFGLGIAWKEPGDSEWSAIPQSAMSPAPGYYPSVIAAHQQRLILAGFTSLPLKAYVSETFNWENFETGPEADDPFLFEIAANDVNRILWMISKDDALIVGTAPREYRIMGKDGVFSGGEILVRPNTTHGSVYIQPVEGEDNIYFVDRSGINVREYTFIFERDKSVGVPIDLLCGDLLKNGIKKIVFQSGNNAAFSFGFGGYFYPHRLNILWVLTDPGELFYLVREVSEKVYAWGKFETEGTIESMTITPAADGDILWLCVNRTVNSTAVKFLEVLDPQQLFDCGQVFSNEDGAVFKELSDDTIECIFIHDSADWVHFYNVSWGYALPLDSTGIFPLAIPTYSGCTWLAGIPFYGVMETLNFDQQIAQGQTTIGKQKTWVEIILEVYNSLSTNVALSDFPNDKDSITRTELYTGDDRFFVQGWTRGAALRVEQTEPFPLTIRSIGGELMVNI